eukprot:TRINITY_DN2249_c0_g1_i1.p1 TRINITY_DN2249_c0_g1~~TRINITY_DN2249_c0_g1_i1.p1  ORF type:complete len:540 (-),score=160.88 TRINITY_DN2249_c0_g1_i1:502-2121(-)
MGLKPNITDKWVSFLSESRRHGLFSDLRLHTSDGSHFTAHKLVVGATWFLSGSMESDAIILDGFSPSVIRHFLDILYSGATAMFSGEETLRDLRELAKLFGLRNLGLETQFLSHNQEESDEEDEHYYYYYESDESEEAGCHGSSLTVTLEENLSKREIQDRVFVCPRCGEGFHSEASLEGHERTHEEGFEEDPIIEDELPEEEDAAAKREAISCSHCVLGPFSSKAELTKHAFNSHPQARRCLQCDKEFKEPKSLSYHSKYVCPKIKREFFKCRSCESKFPSPRDARRHEKAAHGSPRAFKCPSCPSICKSSSSLSNHIKVAHHPEALRFKCPECGKAFLKAAYLEDHRHRFHVPEKQFPCELCSKKFSTRSDLQRHAGLIHEGGKSSFACSYCSLSFAYRSTLTQHVRSAHTGEKPYKCRPCNKAFAFLEVLKKHKKSHDRKGDPTLLVTAPKGQKGSNSYIDFAPGSQPPPNNFPTSSSGYTQLNAATTPTIPAFEGAQSFNNYPPGGGSSYSSKFTEASSPEQITNIDIMELLSKN